MGDKVSAELRVYCTCYGTQSNLMAGGLSSKTKGLGLSPEWDFVLCS